MRKILSRLFLFFIRSYQIIISPYLGKCCRFYPSCSEYATQAIKKYGPYKGLYLTLKRLAKCHPLHPGGVDTIEE